MFGHRQLPKNNLITALTACAEISVRTRARRFLLGLSADELQFLAEFVGSCILESSEDIAGAANKVELSEYCLAKPGPQQLDRADKLILLREYLRRSLPS
jgi:hypothetical protein